MDKTTRTLRERSRSRDPDSTQQSQVKTAVKDKTKEKMSSDRWVEPAVVQRPSFREGGSNYGVSEYMQPLGEAPNARVKARVKVDCGRKSLLGKGSGAIGVDAQNTPEGTPQPPTQTQRDTPTLPQIKIEDENDGDYAPAAGKRKDRAAKPRAAKRQSDAPSASGTAGSAPPKPQKPLKNINKNKKYDAVKLWKVVEAAKERAMEVGKPDLAAAVNEIYENSLTDARLTELLEAILTQEATKAQTHEFQDYVRAAKRKLKDAKEAKRDLPESTNGTHSLPLRSPSKFTPEETESTAIPSTEQSETPKAKISLKSPSKSPSKEQNRRRSGNGGSMSASPSKKRSGSVDSDSSLTDMTSNPDDDMDVDEPDEGENEGATRVNGIKVKDHAAERGSLAAPNRNLKRSSAEADLQEEERDRVLATKKQKLNEAITRDYRYQESSLRGSPNTNSARLRTLRGKNVTLAPPSVSAKTNGGRNGSTRGSRAVSTDADSPLSSPMSSRQSTPHVYKGPTKPFGKKAKTKQSPEKKHLAASSGMLGASGAGRESPIGDDDNEELSENNDFCSACGGSGFLLCCDGCDRSFHFSCLDPPLNEDASELNEPWYCYICVAKRPVTTGSPEKPRHGLFAPLFSSLKKRNPSNFALPQDIRDHFEGVATDRNGAFVEAVHTKTRNRPGYDETPDFTKTKDGKGNILLCYSCGKSSQGTRPIIQCDYCGENWHLDCLDPPLANPPARNLEGKKLHDWMCPLHADHELRRVDTSLLNRRGVGRKVHIRKPRNPKVVTTSLRRGLRNNGVIDVLEDESDDSDSEFYDEDSQDDTVYRLPASGIKLDFIDKVKYTRVQQLRSEHAFRRARIAAEAPRQLEQANFARRSFVEKQMALNLAQFASANKDVDLGSDQVENLVGMLIAEAPSEVVDEMMAAEENERARSVSSAIPPSPPSSDQTDQLSAEQRKELQMLQELIRRRLDNSKT